MLPPARRRSEQLLGVIRTEESASGKAAPGAARAPRAGLTLGYDTCGFTSSWNGDPSLNAHSDPPITTLSEPWSPGPSSRPPTAAARRRPAAVAARRHAARLA